MSPAALSDRPIVVTGADGFVGQRLVPALRAAFNGVEIVGTSRSAHAGLQELDICDRPQVQDFIRMVKPRALIHLAALSSVDDAFKDPFLTYETNLTGTLHLAQAILDGSPETLMVFASSGEVYGESLVQDVAVDEASLLRPVNPYAASKAAADLALGQMSVVGLRAIRLRLFNHTGAGQSPRFVLPRIAKQVAAIMAGAKPPRIETGPLERWRDFLDLRDVIAAYIAVLRQPGDAKGAFNVASGTGQSLRAAARRLAALGKVEVTFVEHAMTPRPFDTIYSSGNPASFARTFGWQPTISWDETLQALLDYWLADGRYREP